MLSILSHVGRGTALFEQVSASSGMLHGMLDKRVNKKAFTNVMYDLSQNFVALSLSFTVFQSWLHSLLRSQTLPECR